MTTKDKIKNLIEQKQRSGELCLEECTVDSITAFVNNHSYETKLPEQKEEAVLKALELKHCSKCGAVKPLTSFYRDRKSKDGLSWRCKVCCLEAAKIYAKTEKAGIARRAYYHRTKEMYRERNRLYLKHRRDTNPKFRLKSKMSSSIARGLIKGDRRSWEQKVGYTIDELMDHLESKFEKWMNWDNYGKGKGKWSVDHIIPIDSFSYTSANDKEFKKCWALSNLQPLCFIENIIKGNKIQGKCKKIK